MSVNTNCQFPIINYDSKSSQFEWGCHHGEEFQGAIKELAQIRKSLMLSKNPKLLSKLDELAQEQFQITLKYCPHIAEEIKGISTGSKITLTDIVILNNYTDFRDLNFTDECCSTIHVQYNNNVFSGQTWDMHRSAKNYMCVLNVPEKGSFPSKIVLSLVGCVGLMGINAHNCMIGVNNINTTNAKTGLIWPALVRKALESNTLEQMHNILVSAPVTSGHNYLISSPLGSKQIEVTPTVSEIVSQINVNQNGAIYHTNHCLGDEIKKWEDKSSISSTTFNRFELLNKKAKNIQDFSEFIDLLNSHDEFPKSICSHFENGAQDPSFTCGGGASDFSAGIHLFWRGCKAYDSDFKQYKFQLHDNQFKLI